MIMSDHHHLLGHLNDFSYNYCKIVKLPSLLIRTFVYVYLFFVKHIKHIVPIENHRAQ